MMVKRSPIWFSRTAFIGLILGAIAGVASWSLIDARSTPLRGVSVMGLIIAGYALGAAAGARRQGRRDLEYILRLREDLRLTQDHIIDNETFRSLASYLDTTSSRIKDPLERIAAGFKSLSADPRLFEESRRALEQLSIETERLRAALAPLADYSLTKPSRAPFSLNTLLGETIALCRHRAEEKNIIFEERYAVVPPVFGPAARVHQALLNVIINAVEAMPHTGGSIAVETAHEGDRVIGRIRDGGIGIRPEHMQRIFDPFFTTKAGPGGAGLGLWATRDLLESIGASIAVTSTPLQGTEVVLSFPEAAPLRAGRSGTAHPPELERNTADEGDRQIA